MSTGRIASGDSYCNRYFYICLCDTADISEILFPEKNNNGFLYTDSLANQVRASSSIHYHVDALAIFVYMCIFLLYSMLVIMVYIRNGAADIIYIGPGVIRMYTLIQ